MLDGAAVQKIADLQREALSLTVVNPPGEAPGVYYLRKPDGSVEKCQAAPPAQNHDFTNLDNLFDWGWNMHFDGRAGWVDLGEGVQITIPDARGSRARFPVGYSKTFHRLGELAQSPVWWDQKQFVTELRTTFAGCVGPSLVALFRNLKIKTGGEIQANIGHQTSNIGKSLEATITGADAIPETIRFDVQVQADPFLLLAKRPVECALDVDPQQGKFRLLVLPLELERAIGAASIDLYNLVQDSVRRTRPGDQGGPIPEDTLPAHAGFPLYAGRPGEPEE